MKHIAKRTVIILVTAILLMVSLPTVAQEDGAGSLAESWVVSVDMASQPAFEEALRAHMAVRSEAGDSASWQVFTNNTGDTMSTYYIRNCCFSWAARDAYDAWGEENPGVMNDWNANVHPHVSNYGHHYYEFDSANSNWPEEGTPKFVGVTTYKIKTGSGQQFEAAKSELSQAAINEGWAEAGHHWAWSSSVDGKPTVGLVIPFENYADMATPDPSFFQFLSEHMGSEEAAGEIFQRFTSATDGSTYSIYTHRADLSMQ